MIDGHYLNWQDFADLCQQASIVTVPLVASIPFNLAEVKRYSEGKTMLMQEQPHIREGVVVKPLQERNDPKLGRVTLKYISDTYLFGDFHQLSVFLLSIHPPLLDEVRLRLRRVVYLPTR